MLKIVHNVHMDKKILKACVLVGHPNIYQEANV